MKFSGVAEKNVMFNAGKYKELFNNCQDFADRLRSEYSRLELREASDRFFSKDFNFTSESRSRSSSWDNPDNYSMGNFNLNSK